MLVAGSPENCFQSRHRDLQMHPWVSTSLLVITVWSCRVDSWSETSTLRSVVVSLRSPWLSPLLAINLTCQGRVLFGLRLSSLELAVGWSAFQRTSIIQLPASERHWRHFKPFVDQSSWNFGTTPLPDCLRHVSFRGHSPLRLEIVENRTNVSF